MRTYMILAAASIFITGGSMFGGCNDNGTEPSETTIEGPPQFILQWGKRLDLEGTLLYPGGVATDGGGRVFVIDAGHDLIQIYSDQGVWINGWQQEPSKNSCIAVDASGRVYLEIYNSDFGRRQLTRFTSEGQEPEGWPFVNITGLASDHAGSIYVNGSRIRDDSSLVIGSGVWKVSTSGEILASWGHIASGPITVDGNGNLYLLDNYILESGRYATVEKFNRDGVFIKKWKVGEGDLDNFISIAADSEGNVYLTHPYEDMIFKYDTNGCLLVTWSHLSPNNEPLRTPFGVAVDAEDKLYVSDWHDRIIKFSY